MRTGMERTCVVLACPECRQSKKQNIIIIDSYGIVHTGKDTTICKWCDLPYDDHHRHDKCEEYLKGPKGMSSSLKSEPRKLIEEMVMEDRADRTERNILIEANNIVHGDRNKAYGHPEDNHTTTAILFSHFLKRKYGKGMGTTPLLDAEDVCFFNILQKISRAANSYRRDNLVDIAGFAANIEMIKDQEITEIHSERR